ALHLRRHRGSGPLLDLRPGADGRHRGHRGGGEHPHRAFVPARKPMIRVMLVALALWAGSAPAAPNKDFDREIPRQRRELDELREKLRREQKQLESLREKKVSTLGRLEKIAAGLRTTEEYLAKLDDTEETLNKSVSAVRGELGTVEERIRDRNEVMARRVRALFVSGGPDREVLRDWEGGQGDFMRKVFFMKRVLRYDKSLVEAGREDAEAKRKALGLLNGRISELDGFRKRKAREKLTFGRARLEQQKRLAEIQSNEQAKREALKEIEENARLITEIIATLEKRRKK